MFTPLPPALDFQAESNTSPRGRVTMMMSFKAGNKQATMDDISAFPEQSKSSSKQIRIVDYTSSVHPATKLVKPATNAHAPIAPPPNVMLPAPFPLPLLVAEAVDPPATVVDAPAEEALRVAKELEVGAEDEDEPDRDVAFPPLPLDALPLAPAAVLVPLSKVNEPEELMLFVRGPIGVAAALLAQEAA